MGSSADQWLRQALRDNPDLAEQNPELVGRHPGNSLGAVSVSRGGGSEYTEPMLNMLAWIGAPTPVLEHRFHGERGWRFDMAWPELMVALEIDGGVWTQGRHTRGKGFIEDCAKLAEAAILGWRVIRVPSDWVNDGTAVVLVERLLKAAGASW